MSVTAAGHALRLRLRHGTVIGGHRDGSYYLVVFNYAEEDTDGDSAYISFTI